MAARKRRKRQRTPDLPLPPDFCRMAMCFVAAKGDEDKAAALVKKFYPDMRPFPRETR